jgi:4-amino-4-deoxy-L-arabinose transferase-like glycosyltransferase
LLAATFRLLGVGLLQARLETVALGLLVLILTHALARRLFSARVGLVAVAFLLVVRLVGTTRYLITGIPFVDLARICRYDMAVPVFGLAALLLYVVAPRRPGAQVLAGLAAGLAGLSHLYGAFWIVALLVLALFDRRGVRAVGAMLLGVAIAWLPYLAYVLAHPVDWLGQMRGYAPRFDLLHVDWYRQNLLREPQRYGPGLGPTGWGYLARPGFWATLLLLPASAFALLRRGIVADDGAARIVVIPALVLFVAFSLLLQSKVVNYVLTLLPLAAIALAWGVNRLFAGGRWRAVLSFALAAVILEGGTRLALLQEVARATTPYEEFVRRVRQHVPDGMRILGLHKYWLGFHDRDYRAWVVLLWMRDPDLSPRPMSVENNLDRLQPGVLLVDSDMQASLAGDREGFFGWLSEHGFTVVATIADPTYGRVQIYARVQ